MEELFNKKNLELFGKEYIKELIKVLKNTDKDSSGKLINSIDFRIQKDANQINTLILSEDYLKYIDKGRKAGSWPPIQEISKWANLKGISQDAVFPIAYKIFKFGIKPTNIIDKTIKNILTNNKIESDIENTLVNNIEEQIIKTIIHKK